MARNKGIFNKIMNVIGLVEDPNDGYEDNYQDYGRNTHSSRPSTYVPQQQRSRTQDTRSRTVVPTNSRYGQRNDVNEGYTVRRTERAYENAPETSVPSSLNRTSAPARRSAAPAPAPRATAPARVPAAPAAASAGAARTIMCPITSLEECCDVIDILVANNIVLVTMDQMDTRLSQRAVDTLSGAAFALQATLKKASDNTYLIAPRTVMVSETDGFGRRY